jgi:Asp-tRNA(Asn)/Glu-tRNA(Gln) amidotransferase A subunit family amidase
MSELTSKTIADLRDGLRSREFSALEVAEAYNAAVAGAKALNAYTVTTPDDALAGAVPEPATWAMMILGFGAIGWSVRRGRKSAQGSANAA